MSLSAIQDNLVKTNLVQQHQSRGDDISRSQEIAHTAAQREVNRQEDQVVIHARETEQQKLRADEEKEREGKKREKEEEEENKKDQDVSDDSVDEDGRPRARMRRINIVV